MSTGEYSSHYKDKIAIRYPIVSWFLYVFTVELVQKYCCDDKIVMNSQIHSFAFGVAVE